MRTNFKKILALLACLCLLLPTTVFLATADTGVSIDFDDASNRTAYSAQEQVWEQNGITVTNNKAGSTSNVGDYTAPARFYKSSSLTVAYPGMTKVVFYCNDYKASYVTDLQSSITTGTVTVDGTVVTVEFDAAVDILEIATLAAQVRVHSITVFTGDGSSDPGDEPDEPQINTVTYNFADYKVDGELGGGEFSRDLDENVKFTISSGWFTTQARIYKNANGVIASQLPISSMTPSAMWITTSATLRANSIS